MTIARHPQDAAYYCKYPTIQSFSLTVWHAVKKELGSFPEFTKAEVAMVEYGWNHCMGAIDTAYQIIDDRKSSIV